ncbi:MAG: hypothetical protein A3G66_01555 [Candidatus Levybacteria bacterium RIFCSPLOWO2_12_FULL_39_17]|nr:MAG: hypothetical protein A3G66_01555 [Candidatus Levybacteria bacterium RIFCSPLOWO2_12_FULL_39_17]
MKIALDSNIFIYALENKKELGDLSRKLLAELKEQNHQLVTSVLTIQEVLVGVYKERLVNRINEYLEFISGEGRIAVIDFNREVAVISARIRADYPQIKTPDAIQLATAINQGASRFYTADKKLPKKIGRLTIKSI